MGMHSIASMSMGRKCLASSVLSHHPDIASINSDTSSGGEVEIAATGVKRFVCGVQFCRHTYVEFPFPILEMRPNLRMSRPSTSARHIWEGEDPRLAYKMFVSGKYTDLRILALNNSGVIQILQTCRANKAKLNNSKSRNPKPPIYFGIVRVSHDTQ